MIYKNTNKFLIASLLSVTGFEIVEETIQRNNKKYYQIKYSNEKKLQHLLNQYQHGTLSVNFEKYKNNLEFLNNL